MDWFLALVRGLKIYTPVHVVPFLVFKLKKLKTTPVESIRNIVKGIVVSCVFIATYVWTVKTTMCVTRHLRG